MRPALSLAAAAAALASLPAGAPAASCGNLNGGFETRITTVGVNCGTAHAVIRRWHRKAVGNGEGPGSKYVFSFFCVSRATGPEHVRVNCADGARKIRFYAGP